MGRPWGRTVTGRLVGLLLPAAALFLGGLADPGSIPASGEPDLQAAGPLRGVAGDELRAKEPPLRRVGAGLRRGQTVAGILSGFGLQATESQELVEILARSADLRRLGEGTPCVGLLDASGGLVGFELEMDGRGRLEASRTGDRWNAIWRPFERSVAVRSVQGVLEGAFENAVERAGAPSELAYAVADVLQWDLDFNRDLRAGDRFEVLFEESFVEGRSFGLGNVLAVRYQNRGRVVEAYRFGKGEYFDGEGRPLQKMFLRSPIPYSRVTSRFSSRRFHPILKVARPHYGVDYGAPEGTPARATAAGVVTFLGWEGGGGKTVKIRHPNGFLTAYLHLSRFPSGLAVGGRVAQGEVVGFVGSTGLATGPHLDYRVQQNGRWIDPLSLNRVPADPVPMARLSEVRASRDRMRDGLVGKGTPPGFAIVAGAYGQAPFRSDNLTGAGLALADPKPLSR